MFCFTCWALIVDLTKKNRKHLIHSNKLRIDTVRQTSRKHNYKDKPVGFIEGSIFRSFRGRKREQ